MKHFSKNPESFGREKRLIWMTEPSPETGPQGDEAAASAPADAPAVSAEKTAQQKKLEAELAAATSNRDLANAEMDDLKTKLLNEGKSPEAVDAYPAYITAVEKFNKAQAEVVALDAQIAELNKSTETVTTVRNAEAIAKEIAEVGRQLSAFDGNPEAWKEEEFQILAAQYIALWIEYIMVLIGYKEPTTTTKEVPKERGGAQGVPPAEVTPPAEKPQPDVFGVRGVEDIDAEIEKCNEDIGEDDTRDKLIKRQQELTKAIADNAPESDVDALSQELNEVEQRLRALDRRKALEDEKRRRQELIKNLDESLDERTKMFIKSITLEGNDIVISFTPIAEAAFEQIDKEKIDELKKNLSSVGLDVDKIQIDGKAIRIKDIPPALWGKGEVGINEIYERIKGLTNPKPPETEDETDAGSGTGGAGAPAGGAPGDISTEEPSGQAGADEEEPSEDPAGSDDGEGSDVMAPGEGSPEIAETLPEKLIKRYTALVEEIRAGMPDEMKNNPSSPVAEIIKDMTFEERKLEEGEKPPTDASCLVLKTKQKDAVRSIAKAIGYSETEEGKLVRSEDRKELVFTEEYCEIDVREAFGTENQDEVAGILEAWKVRLGTEVPEVTDEEFGTVVAIEEDEAGKTFKALSETGVDNLKDDKLYKRIVALQEAVNTHPGMNETVIGKFIANIEIRKEGEKLFVLVKQEAEKEFRYLFSTMLQDFKGGEVRRDSLGNYIVDITSIEIKKDVEGRMNWLEGAFGVEVQQDSLEAIREEIENPAEITSTEELNRDRIAEIDKELSTFVTAFSALSSEEKNKYRYVMYFYGNDLTKKLLGQHKPDFDPVAAAKKEKPDVKPFKTFEEYKANIEMADEMYGAPADDAFDVSDEEAAEARAELTREQMKKELEEFAVKVIKELEGNEAFIKLLTGGEQEALGKYIFIAWAYENGIELIKEILEEHTEGFDPIAAAKSKRPGETPKISFEVLNEM